MMQDMGIHMDDENDQSFQDLSLEEKEVRRTLWVSSYLVGILPMSLIVMPNLVDCLHLGYNDESHTGAITDMARDWPSAKRIPPYVLVELSFHYMSPA